MLRLYSTPSKLSDWEPSALTPQNLPVFKYSLKTVSRKAESVFCASSLLSAGKREGTGGWWWGRGGLLVWKCLVQITHSRRPLFMITLTETGQKQRHSKSPVKRTNSFWERSTSQPQSHELRPGDTCKTFICFRVNEQSNTNDQKMDRFSPGCWLVNSCSRAAKIHNITNVAKTTTLPFPLYRNKCFYSSKMHQINLAFIMLQNIYMSIH